VTDAPTERDGEGAWAKMRHRKVVQWGIVYAAGAWGFLQGLEYLSGTYDWPRQIQQLVTLALLIGLPVVLVLAWYHGDRGQHRVTVVELAILAVLLAAGGAVLWSYELRRKPASVSETREATRRDVAGSEQESLSIAVLPFENRSRLEDDVFFVEGIHDDILTQLSKVGALTVISRTSVEQFRDTQLSIRSIAEKLDVAMILEGGVQRAGNRVRINVQLIDARADTHLWAETYDRELTAASIFAIQSEVATAIAAALKATLTTGEKVRVWAPSTQKLEAWEAYQLGRQRLAKRTSESLAEAEQYFKRAVEIDPKFAVAYVGVADTLVLRLGYTGYPLAATLEKADAAIQQALALEPRLAEAVAGAATVALLKEDYAAAEAGFRRAIDLSPSSATAYRGCTQLYGLMGRNDDSLRCATKAAELDPLSVSANLGLGRALERVGRFDDALARYRKAIEIDPSVPSSYLFVGSTYAHGLGRLDQAVPWFERAARIDPGSPTYSLVLGGTHVDLGNIAEARRWLADAIRHGAEYQDVATVEALVHLYEGNLSKAEQISRKVLDTDPRNPYALNMLRIVGLRTGHRIEVLDLYLKAFPELVGTNSPVIDGSNYQSTVDLAGLLLDAGDRNRAAGLLDGSESVIRSTQRMGWEGYGMLDVQIHALRGDKIRALAALREAETAGWRSFGWRYYRDFDPNLASIRDEPEFKAIFADIERDMARQRAELAKRPKDAPLDLGVGE
jgi:TolB-like protein/cytochrome c-type biogenesis protein CcmH/NrfG